MVKSLKHKFKRMDTSKSLAIIEKGDPRGVPLVLIHGGAGGVWAWDEALKFLGDFRCLLPELPEHGSSPSNGPFSIQAAAQGVVQAVRERVPGGRAHVFGLSVGGQIVVEMLARAPETLLSAVVSSALLLPVPGYRLGLYSERAMALAYWLGIAPWKHSDAWMRWSMRVSAGLPEVFFERFKGNFQGLTRSGWAHGMSEFYRYRAPAGLEHADLPVLLVAGAHETADAQPTNRLLHRRLPRSRMVLLRLGRGGSAAQEHNWPMTAPELCAQTIRAWVSGQALPAELIDLP
jgi:pimeloyl-ACP methyl ester carboxylesterase